MNKMNGDQICRGCIVFENGKCFIKRLHYLDLIDSIKYFKKCPCRNCLIKGICQRACDDFDIFVNDVRVNLRDLNGATEHEFEG